KKLSQNTFKNFKLIFLQKFIILTLQDSLLTNPDCLINEFNNKTYTVWFGPGHPVQTGPGSDR
ncbi:unnamed protein product, partial [Musa textilis]